MLCPQTAITVVVNFEVGYSLWSKCNTISITTYILRVDTEHFCCIFYLLLLVGIIVLFDIFVTQYSTADSSIVE